VRDLDQAGGLALTAVGDAAAERRQQRRDGVERLPRAGDGDGQLARRDDLGVAADGGGEEFGASASGDGAGLGRDLRGDGGGVDDDVRRLGAGQQPAVAGEDGFEVAVRGDHDEDDVAVGEVHRAVDDLRAAGGERLCLGLGAVVHGNVVAGPQQAQRQLIAHPPGADPPHRGRPVPQRVLL
jgi:hypothetical protein